MVQSWIFNLEGNGRIRMNRKDGWKERRTEIKSNSNPVKLCKKNGETNCEKASNINQQSRRNEFQPEFHKYISFFAEIKLN
jgi:hypothetical protein